MLLFVISEHNFRLDFARMITFSLHNSQLRTVFLLDFHLKSFMSTFMSNEWWKLWKYLLQFLHHLNSYYDWFKSIRSNKILSWFHKKTKVERHRFWKCYMKCLKKLQHLSHLRDFNGSFFSSVRFLISRKPHRYQLICLFDGREDDQLFQPNENKREDEKKQCFSCVCFLPSFMRTGY